MERYISTPDLLITQGYQYIDEIGEGSVGKTYRAKNLRTGEIVAIKALKFNENLKNYELFRREADVLKSLRIKGVPRYYDFISQDNDFTECWLVQEYIEGKSLQDVMEEGKTFNEFETLLIMREIAKIVFELQTNYAPPIIHRDIKPSNILIEGDLDNDFKLHLIDFGAVANPQKRSGGSTVAGTVGYMAPEQLLGDCSLQSDYYAIGATALHLLTGIAPCDMKSDGFNLHYAEELSRVTPKIHPETLRLFGHLLAPKAQDRPADAAALNALIDNAMRSYYKLCSFSKRNALKAYVKDPSLLKKSGAVPGICLTVAGIALVLIAIIGYRDSLALSFGAALTCIGILIAYCNFDQPVTAHLISDDASNEDSVYQTVKAELSAQDAQKGASKPSYFGTIVARHGNVCEVAYEQNGQTFGVITKTRPQYKVGDKIRLYLDS